MILLIIAIASLMGMKSAGPAPQPLPLHAAVEVGVLALTGANKVENVNAAMGGDYTFGRSNLAVFGHYLQTKADGIESAHNWNSGVEYDYSLDTHGGVYLNYKAEADPFAGYIQRDTEGLGYRYFVLKTPQSSVVGGIGYLHSKTIVQNGGILYESKWRLFQIGSWKLSETWTLADLIEIIPNFTNHDSNLINAEISLSAMMTKTLSLKYTYQHQYQETPYVPGTHNFSTSTLNLVAQF